MTLLNGVVGLVARAYFATNSIDHVIFSIKCIMSRDLSQCSHNSTRLATDFLSYFRYQP